MRLVVRGPPATSRTIPDRSLGHPDEVNDDKLTVKQIIMRSLSKFSTQRIGPLFANWRLGLSTTLIWFIWLTIGMGYPLFNGR